MKTKAAILGAIACCAAVSQGQEIEYYFDPVGDAVIRRTDPGATAALNPQSTLPDVVMLKLSGWTFILGNDPYSGWVPTSGQPDLFRLDLVFKGVVNPPGRLEFANFDPFRFGPSPLHGFLDLDMDRDADTGGEYYQAGQHRYLANAARFGGVGQGSHGSSRSVRLGIVDINSNFYSPPQFERSGAEFSLVFCGCWPTAIVSEGGNGNGIFEAGETWRVRSRFWQRAGGYIEASFMSGGSQFGLYDPEVVVRWSHDIATDRTTVSLIHALTMPGAALLAGTTQVPPLNSNAADATSVHEGLQDVINAATLGLPPNSIPWFFAHEWAGQTVTEDILDPTRWKPRGLFGTTYLDHQAGAPYVWTDIAFEHRIGDQNGDELVNSADRIMVRNTIASMDGGPQDCDGVVNGSVLLCNPGPNFSCYDIDGNGRIDVLDSLWYCRVDINDDMMLNIADFSAFLQAYSAGDPRADINRDGLLNIADFSAFLQRFGQGCP